MAKYVIDIDFGDDDCSFCPFFVQHPHDAWCVYSDDERELTEELRDALDGVNKVWCFDRPDWCPLVPYVTAKPYVNHGDHGPEPRFKGDAWTMWHCCGNCDHQISHGDNYCKTCGAKIDWSDDA